MTDYERGVELASAVYKDVIREYVAENEKLRELVRDALTTISWCTIDCYPSDNKKRELNERAKELGIEVDDGLR